MRLFIRLTILSLVVSLTAGPVAAQNLDDLSFGSDGALEVITWNIEWFPKDGQATIDSVARIIEALDADVYALQEIWDTASFNILDAALSGYDGYYETDYASGLVYLVKNPSAAGADSMSVERVFEIYDEPLYWNAFPRSPLVLELTHAGEMYRIINNHLKCCGDGFLDTTDTGDEETRRWYAVGHLKEYMDSLADDQILMVGDLNDMLNDPPAHNIFKSLLEDDSSYLFADYDIAWGLIADWSYPSWPSHLDHILLSDELFLRFQETGAEILTLKIEENLAGGWDDYDDLISDHRPVGIRLPVPATPLGFTAASQSLDPVIHPNPVQDFVYVAYDDASAPVQVVVYDITGQIVGEIFGEAGRQNLTWHAGHLPNGMYMLHFQSDDETIAVRKMMRIN